MVWHVREPETTNAAYLILHALVGSLRRPVSPSSAHTRATIAGTRTRAARHGGVTGGVLRDASIAPQDTQQITECKKASDGRPHKGVGASSVSVSKIIIAVQSPTLWRLSFQYIDNRVASTVTLIAYIHHNIHCLSHKYVSVARHRGGGRGGVSPGCLETRTPARARRGSVVPVRP
jgi:hypothetical protein